MVGSTGPSCLVIMNLWSVGSGDQGCWQTAGCVDSFGDEEVRGGGSSMSCMHMQVTRRHRIA